ncbi:type II toxin-antitoxin system YoeB family toxin [Calothrix sp. CCY 0018]|uniref:type II toxin-antitoxin system YoeB family toxin n=1 Tax=Calothrix sp. CCY 0018 TaxID=3103864 RepID=UPI0039C76066
MGANGEIKREAVFQPEFLEDLEYWVNKDRKMALRVLKMVKEILRKTFAISSGFATLSDF